MGSMFKKLISDFRGIWKLCGPAVAVKWAGCIGLSLRHVLRSRELLTADARMGRGPFHLRSPWGKVLLRGESVFSGLRELWVRQSYSRGGFLEIPDRGTVVDLGSNLGNFTMMALAASRTARVIAVEPGRRFKDNLLEAARLNGFEGRVEYCGAFVGSFTEIQNHDVAHNRNYRDVPRISEKEFLARFGIEWIDFLKVDIEGSEYFLLDTESRMLDITDRLAIELHGIGGDPHEFLEALERKAFQVRSVEWAGDTCVVLASRR